VNILSTSLGGLDLLGLVDLPAQLRARLAGGLSGGSGLGGAATKKG